MQRRNFLKSLAAPVIAPCIIKVELLHTTPPCAVSGVLSSDLHYAVLYDKAGQVIQRAPLRCSSDGTLGDITFPDVRHQAARWEVRVFGQIAAEGDLTVVPNGGSVTLMLDKLTLE